MHYTELSCRLHREVLCRWGVKTIVRWILQKIQYCQDWVDTTSFSVALLHGTRMATAGYWALSTERLTLETVNSLPCRTSSNVVGTALSEPPSPNPPTLREHESPANWGQPLISISIVPFYHPTSYSWLFWHDSVMKWCCVCIIIFPLLNRVSKDTFCFSFEWTEIKMSA